MGHAKRAGANDSILIEDLEVFTLVGVHEFEHRAKQKVLVSLELETGGIDAAAERDDIALALDWAAVCEAVARVAGERPRKLIETLAYDLAETILGEFPVLEATVKVAKLSRTDARSQAVRITRVRERAQ